MLQVLTTTRWSILFILLLLSSCGEEEPEPMALDCQTQVADCLTNGSRQAYYPYKPVNGVINTNPCIVTFQLGFSLDGTFTFFVDDLNCPPEIEDGEGTWTLETSDTEIHLKPGVGGETVSVFKIIELNEMDLTMKGPQIFPSPLSDTVIWRRI